MQTFEKNSVYLTGRIGNDGELKYTPSGVAICEFSLAQNYKRGDEKTTMWHRCTVFGKYAEMVAPGIKKGANVAVFGRLDQQSWEGKDGKRNYKTVIVAEKLLTSQNSGAGYEPDL